MPALNGFGGDVALRQGEDLLGVADFFRGDLRIGDLFLADFSLGDPVSPVILFGLGDFLRWVTFGWSRG